MTKHIEMDEFGRRRWVDADLDPVLAERQRDIVRSHDKGESFAAIGRRYGISRERVRQIYVSAKRA